MSQQSSAAPNAEERALEDLVGPDLLAHINHEPNQLDFQGESESTEQPDQEIRFGLNFKRSQSNLYAQPEDSDDLVDFRIRKLKLTGKFRKKVKTLRFPVSIPSLRQSDYTANCQPDRDAELMFLCEKWRAAKLAEEGDESGGLAYGYLDDAHEIMPCFADGIALDSIEYTEEPSGPAEDSSGPTEEIFTEMDSGYQYYTQVYADVPLDSEDAAMYQNAAADYQAWLQMCPNQFQMLQFSQGYDDGTHMYGSFSHDNEDQAQYPSDYHQTQMHPFFWPPPEQIPDTVYKYNPDQKQPQVFKVVPVGSQGQMTQVPVMYAPCSPKTPPVAQKSKQSGLSPKSQPSTSSVDSTDRNKNTTRRSNYVQRGRPGKHFGRNFDNRDKNKNTRYTPRDKSFNKRIPNTYTPKDREPSPSPEPAGFQPKEDFFEEFPALPEARRPVYRQPGKGKGKNK